MEKRMKDPVDHILRPRLPWRDNEGAMTECGYDASKVSTITREGFERRLKDLGQQRTAMVTCMTCSSTAGRWKDWDSDPRQALGREIEWERGGGFRARTDRGQRLKDELEAISALIDAHRNEFDGIIRENQRRRAWNEQKAAMSLRPKVSGPRAL
jgi:hypothetical protein